MGDLSKWAGSENDKKQLIKSVRSRLGDLLTKNGMQFGNIRIGDFLDYEAGIWDGYGPDLEKCGYSRDDRDGLFTDLIYESQEPLLESHANAFSANRGKAYGKDYIRETLDKPALEKTGKWLVEEARDNVPPDWLNDDSRIDDEPLPDEDDDEDDVEGEESSDASDGQNPGNDSGTEDSDKTAQTDANAGKAKDKKKEAEKAAQAAEEANKAKNKKNGADEAEAQEQAGPKLGSELSHLHEMGALSDNEYRCGMALGQIMTMSVKNAPVMRALLDPVNYLTTSQRASLYGKHVARMLEKELKRSQKLDAEIASLYDDIKERGVKRAERIQGGEKVDLEKEAGKKPGTKQEQKGDAGSGKSGEKRSVLSWIGDKIHRPSGKDDVEDEPEEAVNQPEAGEGTVSGEEAKAKKFGKAALTAVQTGAVGLAGCLTGVTLGVWNKAKNIGDVIRRAPAYQTFVQFPAVMWLKDTAHKISDSIKEARESHKAAGEHDCTKEGNEVTFVSNTDPCPEKISLDKEFVKSFETVVRYLNEKGFSVQIVQNQPDKAPEAATLKPETAGKAPEMLQEGQDGAKAPVTASEAGTAGKGPDVPQEGQDGAKVPVTAPEAGMSGKAPETPQEGQDGVKVPVTASEAGTAGTAPETPQERQDGVEGQDTVPEAGTAGKAPETPQEGQDGAKVPVTAPEAGTAGKGPEMSQDAGSEMSIAEDAGKALDAGVSPKTNNTVTNVPRSVNLLGRQAAETDSNTASENEEENDSPNVF